jgi:hypothetical protein
MTDLLALAERCERADAADEAAVFHEVGHALWQAGDITGEERARWTALIDIGACLVIAVGMVPEGWFWRAGRTSIYSGWASVHKTHPDHGIEGKNEFFTKREHWQPEWTPALALLAAALRAMAAGE